jgi:hypothetical protein
VVQPFTDPSIFTSYIETFHGELRRRAERDARLLGGLNPAA